jgi:DNA repair protein RecO (recombination protein O)
MVGQERSYRTTAIILKRRDFGEADRMLTILTPRHGKVDVLAKGARKLTSPKTGHVELFTRAEMIIHTGRDFGLVAQAEMTAPHVPLREDLMRGAYAAYTAELLDRFTSDTGEEDTSLLYNLTDETLARISDDSDPRLAVRYFEIRLLDLVGFRPELNLCIIGREQVQPADQFFSHVQGGVICPQHAGRSQSSVPIPMMTLKLLRHMQRSSYPHVKALEISPALHDDVERILLGYVTYLLERRLQSVEFVRRVRRVE